MAPVAESESLLNPCPIAVARMILSKPSLIVLLHYSGLGSSFLCYTEESLKSLSSSAWLYMLFSHHAPLCDITLLSALRIYLLPSVLLLTRPQPPWSPYCFSNSWAHKRPWYSLSLCLGHFFPLGQLCHIFQVSAWPCYRILHLWLFCSLTHPKHPEQSLVHSKYSVSICWMC